MPPRSPRHKSSRRFGFDVYGTGGASLARRIPGAGQRRRRRPSTYAEQLLEKQKVKTIYGLDERQFRRQLDARGRVRNENERRQ